MIKADSVSVYFKRGLFKKKITALNDFNITIEKGDIFALLGPNGAGKSTAMYCFLGLIKPDGGNVTINGVEPEPGSPLFENIAYLPEEPHYHLYLTVEEAVRYYASLYREEISESRITEVIEKVGLEKFKDLRMSKCSKGMKQKVGLASCMLKTSEIIFLDEPTRGLDPIMVKEFRNILLELARAGSTIVLNSHILSEVEMVCSRVAIINNGKTIAQDELKNLVKFDLENYSVEFDAPETLPEYITKVERTGITAKGEISKEKLGEFFCFAREKNLKIYACALKKLSLEDAFFDIVRGDKDGEDD